MNYLQLRTSFHYTLQDFSDCTTVELSKSYSSKLVTEFTLSGNVTH